MSATWSSNARRSAMLTVALLVALPGRGEARGVPGEQDTPARPSLAALAAQKAGTVVTSAGQPHAVRSVTKTITLKLHPRIQTTGAATGSRSRSSSGAKSLIVTPLVPNTPRARTERAHVIPYQPIRAARPSAPSVRAPLRPIPSAPSPKVPRASFAPAEVGTE
jgi:hypothetical protein